MAKIKNPILFSKYFDVEEKAFEDEGLINPFINVDTELFIDPILLEKASNKTISEDGITEFREHFQKFIRLLSVSERCGDPAWIVAENLLDLSEPPENGLGYGGSGRSGSSRPDEIRDTILKTTKEIIHLGIKDPELVSLMGFFEEGVGPDTISDFTSKVIIKQLSIITQEFCEKYKIPISANNIVDEISLPEIIDPKGRKTHMVLVPKEIVRDLPVANDWSDIEEAAFANKKIRERVNTLLGNIAQPTITDRKRAIREAALESEQSFTHFLESVKEHTQTYDPNIDALGYYKLVHIIANGFEGLKTSDKYQLNRDPLEIKKLVLDTIQIFKRHVEKGNLWEELWIDDKPKKERSAQLIYYAIAECFCIANDVDISPEANMGGGPIDFKYSIGFNARVLVEIKKSTGTVVHGYNKQLEIYKEASSTQYGIFVIMDYGNMGDKLKKIKAIQKQQIDEGKKASEIIVIDAKKKLSASKRK